MVGPFDYRQVQGMGLLNFIRLRMPSWIGSLKKDLVTSRLTTALPGGLVTEDGGHCSPKDLWVFFYVHVQGGQEGRDMVTSFILSTLIQMNKSRDQGLQILLMKGVSVTSASQILDSFWNIWSQVSKWKKPFSDFPVRDPGMHTLSWGIHKVAVAVRWPGKLRAANNFPAGAGQIVRSNLFLLRHIRFWPDKHRLRLIAIKVPPNPFTWCLTHSPLNRP